MLLLLPREGPLLFLQNPAPGAPMLLLQGQNTSFSRRRLEISQCPLCWPLHMPHQAFLPAESRKLPHACTVKHINSYSGPKNRLWKTRLGRKRWMFNAQHAWKTRFSLQILNKLVIEVLSCWKAWILNLLNSRTCGQSVLLYFVSDKQCAVNRVLCVFQQCSSRALEFNPLCLFSLLSLTFWPLEFLTSL